MWESLQLFLEKFLLDCITYQKVKRKSSVLWIGGKKPNHCQFLLWISTNLMISCHRDVCSLKEKPVASPVYLSDSWEGKKEVTMLWGWLVFGWRGLVSKWEGGSLLKSMGEPDIGHWKMNVLIKHAIGVFLQEALHMREMCALKC